MKAEAETALGEYGSIPVNSLVAKVRATYDFAQMNPQLAARYAQACF